MLFFQQKRVSFAFFSPSSSLSLFFSLIFAGLSPTFSFSLRFCVSCNARLIISWKARNIRIKLLLFLFLYIPYIWTWQSKLNALDNTDTETISASCFRLYWLFLVVSASQDTCSYAISRQNNLELNLGCHTCWLKYFTFGMSVVRTDGGRADGGTVTWLPKFLGWVDYHIFFGMGWGYARALVELRY